MGISDLSSDSRFATTRWSLVVEAGQEPEDASRRALADLATQYWYPLYAFARRRGASVEDAQDLTQGFLTELIASPGFFMAADPERGRFRAFLITAFKHFVGRQQERNLAARRGGGNVTLSMDVDFADGERRYQFEPQDQRTAEKLFERRWAITLLGQVLQSIEAEYAAKGKAAFFQECRGWLTADDELEPQQELAERLGMTHGGLRVAVHRLKKRYRELLRNEVAQTVNSEAEIDDELAALRKALQG